MKNYKMETYGGEHFDGVSHKAKAIAFEKNITVEFDFNGITCVVDRTTNLEWLHRDYSNAHIMEWERVGPHCQSEYTEVLADELRRRNVKAEEEQVAREREYKEREARERETFNAKVGDVSVELSDAKAYEDWRAKNNDAYGAGIFEYAEAWAKLMQAEIASGKTVAQCAEATSHELGFMGITGFMYGAAVSILSKCWKYGEELRKWHNKEYNHEGEGVVNPAILTVGR
jgi:hypothetical protein